MKKAVRILLAAFVAAVVFALPVFAQIISPCQAPMTESEIKTVIEYAQQYRKARESCSRTFEYMVCRQLMEQISQDGLAPERFYYIQNSLLYSDIWLDLLTEEEVALLKREGVYTEDEEQLKLFEKYRGGLYTAINGKPPAKVDSGDKGLGRRHFKAARKILKQFGYWPPEPPEVPAGYKDQRNDPPLTAKELEMAIKHYPQYRQAEEAFLYGYDQEPLSEFDAKFEKADQPRFKLLERYVKFAVFADKLGADEIERAKQVGLYPADPGEEELLLKYIDQLKAVYIPSPYVKNETAR